MTEPTGSKVCRECGQDRPLTEYGKDPAYASGIRSKCNRCAAEYSRRRYHTNPRKRAIQHAASVADRVKRKFPEADTGLSSAAYADRLLTATHCEYCGQANDGTHPFSLDHRQALGNGGRHELINLVPCCEPCNRAKHDMPEGTFVAWLDGVAARRVQLLAQAAD